MPITLRSPSREAHAKSKEGTCPTAADMQAWARSHPGSNIHRQFDCPSCDCGCPEIKSCGWTIPCCVRMVELPERRLLREAERSSQREAAPFCVITRHESKATCEADEIVGEPPAKASPTTCAVGWWSDHGQAQDGGEDGTTRCPMPAEAEGAPPPPPPGIEIVGDGPTELRSALTGRLDGLLIPLVVRSDSTSNTTRKDDAVLVKVRVRLTVR